MTGLNVAVAVLFAAWVAGCASAPGVEIHGDNEVFLKVPAGRMELPEPAPRRYGVGIGVSDYAQYQLTGDQINRPPAQPDGASRASLDGLARIDLQVHRSLALAVIAKGDRMPVGQVKWIARQPRAVGDVDSLAFTVGYGTRDDEFSSDRTCGTVSACSPARARTEVSRSLTELAVIAGRRLNSHALLFGGPFYTHLRYQARHASDRGDQPDVASATAGSADLLGANLGIALRDRQWVRMAIEISFTDADLGSKHDQLWHAGLTHHFCFGPRTRQPPLEY